MNIEEPPSLEIRHGKVHNLYDFGGPVKHSFLSGGPMSMVIKAICLIRNDRMDKSYSPEGCVLQP